MSDAKSRFTLHANEGRLCLDVFDNSGHDFCLRHVWIVAISSFDLYLTELVSEAGLRLVDKMPETLPANLKTISCPLGSVMTFDKLSPADKLVFFQDHIFASIQYRSFYRPDKVSEALSFIWTCPAKEKWSRITAKMIASGRHEGRTEQDIRDELTLIGDRRDLIAHAVDTPPGRPSPNLVDRRDAERVIAFMEDLVSAIDLETEEQLA